MRHSHPADPYAIELDKINIADPFLFSDGDPHAVWQAMRIRDPVRWQRTDGQHGFWSITKHADVERVLRDPHAFTSEGGTLIALIGRPDPASRQQLSATDPPRHTKMRAPIQRFLTGHAPTRFEPTIRGRVREVLANGLAGEPFDFAAAMRALPMATFGASMGVPKADWDRLSELAAMAIAYDDPAYRLESGSDVTMRRAHRELFAYFQDAMDERRRLPGDDLLSILLNLRIDDQPLSPGAVLANCYLLLIGSMITVPEIPKSALLELITTGRYAEWAERPDLLDSGVEEALRWGTSANHVLRYATRTVQLRGKTIRAGDPVVVWFASANRDEEVFADPYRFDIRRSPNRHLAFGSGPHYCVGFGIARITLRLLFEELFSSFESFELAGEVVHLRSNFIAGITRLPVIGKARSRPGASPGGTVADHTARSPAL
jgi:cytochrome P450